ncbi:MAG TPA: glycosyltransferase, partial [Ktedonobacterales bacterium]
MKMGSAASSRKPRATRVCMHVLTTARLDPRVLREASAVAAAGYDVTVVDIERDASRPRTEMMQGVTLKHIVTPGYFKRTRFKPFFLVKLANTIVRGIWNVAGTKADIYHAHDDNALPACFMASRLRRKKLILDAHELPLVQPNLTRWKRLSALARWSLRRMTRRCAGIITVSPPIVDDFQRRYGGPRAILVRNIPPYTPPVSSDRLRQMLGFGPNIRIALYQGGIQENRRLDILVRAAHYVADNVRIIMMGNGESVDKIKALIVSEGVQDRVFVIPAVPYDELIATTASADIGLIVVDGNYSLNQKYGLPNKLFEAMMAGVPVLSSPLEVIVDVLRTYDVGV